MKTFYLFILLSFNSIFCILRAQTFDWAQKGGLWEYDYGYGIATDNSGNVYAAGKFEMNAVFGKDTLPNQGNHDIFIAQYSPSGDLNWIRTGGGPSGDYAHALACDQSTNLYISGEIQAAATDCRGCVTPIVFSGSSITLNAVGDNDAFVTNYDLNGNLLWARSAGGYYDDKAQAVAYDAAGNVFMAGYFNDTAYFGTSTVFNSKTFFGGTTITGNTSQLNDMFIAKYDKNGNFLWVQHAGGPGRDEAKGLGCDAAGNVYVCGLYSAGAVFGNLARFDSTGYYNTFLAKYAPDGTLLWVKSSVGDYDNVAWALTLDKNGLIYVAGEFNASVYFGSVQLITHGMADVFVTCYDENGNVQWAKGAGGHLVDRARGIGCDGTNLYITGQYGDTASFGSFTHIAADSSDIFTAELDNTGTFKWAAVVGGVPDSLELLGYESGNAICADASGNAYATGSTLQGGIFGNTSLTQYSRTDFFVTKVSPGPTGITVQTKNNKGEITLYPNPGNGHFVLDMAQLPEQQIQISVYNAMGQLVDNRTYRSPSLLNLDLSSKSNGMYFVEIRTQNQTLFSEKVILQY